MPETACETTVATAAPATPMPRLIMQIRSKAIFKNEDKVKNTRGVLLSPMARMIPDSILYR